MEAIVSPLVDLLRQYKLLQQEYEFEKNNFYQQTQQAGVTQKVLQGVCWYPVTLVRNYYNSINQLVVEIKRGAGDEIDHQFDHGRPVCFFAVGDMNNPRYFNFSATVSYIKDDRMVAVLPYASALLELQCALRLGVQLFFDDASYKTMLAALTEVMEISEGRLPHLREVLLGNVRPQQREPCL